jgi:hypothetical protein
MFRRLITIATGALMLFAGAAVAPLPAQAGNHQPPLFAPVVVPAKPCWGDCIVKPGAKLTPKSKPLPAGTSARRALTYFYATANQTGLSGINQFGWAKDIQAPSVAAGDFHSLIEVSVQNGNNILELGWTVDPGVFGDNNPHLFTGIWINGVWQGYNPASFVDNSSNAVNNGASLAGAVGTSKTFGVIYTGGAWWVAYNGAYIGSFPGTLWSGAFTTGTVVQAFGEVAANSGSPCTDMGNGTLATSSVGPRVSSMTYNGATTGVNLGISTITNSSYYNAASITARSIRASGPGAC